MKQPTLLELAKQGNVKVIVSLMNRLLKQQGMMVDVERKRDCLEILIESDKRSLDDDFRIPNRQVLVSMIQKWLIALEIQSISRVKVSWQRTGQESPEWTEEAELKPLVPPSASEKLLEQVHRTTPSDAKPQIKSEVKPEVKPANRSEQDDTSIPADVGVSKINLEPIQSLHLLTDLEFDLLSDRDSEQNTGVPTVIQGLQQSYELTSDAANVADLNKEARIADSELPPFSDDLSLRRNTGQDVGGESYRTPEWGAYVAPPVTLVAAKTHPSPPRASLRSSAAKLSPIKTIAQYLLVSLVVVGVIAGIHYLVSVSRPAQPNFKSSLGVDRNLDPVSIPL